MLEESSMNPAMRKICGQVAKQRHTTAEQVYLEMQEAIAEAYRAPQSKEVEAYRARIPSSGGIPSPEELISFLCCELRKENRT